MALFATCLGDVFFAEACMDAARVLRRFGVRVSVPPGQTCCGQPAYSAGHRDEATRMAVHTDRVFRDADHVVLPSGSCAGMIRKMYPGLIETDLPGRTWELAEFLVHVLGLGGAPLGRGLEGRRVVYHHGCHALRELGVREEPLALLRACGADVLPWDGDEECCGFGGVFSTRFPEVSAGMADRKLDALPEGVDAVTSADGGCLLQLAGRAERRGDAFPPFVHLATLLREGTGA